MELRDNEVHGVLEFYNSSQNSQKMYLRIPDKIQLLTSNNDILKYVKIKKRLTDN